MTAPQTAGPVSPGLLKVMERAKADREVRFRSLAHLMDEQCLERAYHRLRADAAEGVDGVSKEQYGGALQRNLQDLLHRLKTKGYRHQPIVRVHLPKDKGKARPIGIGTVEDKVVEGALSEVLGAIYEQDFLDCSYGFRPGRSAHDAVRALNDALYRGPVRVILEADVQSFFDSLCRRTLLEMLQRRVVDGAMLQLVSKCLHAGVLDGEQFTRPEVGAPQGSRLSPLLGNIYLHYALDEWFERDIRPRLRGKALLVRYADDFVIAFEWPDDAQRVLDALGERLGRYGLSLHPDKTRLVPFEQPPRDQSQGKGPATFDFLGFTFYWVRSRSGRWVPRCKTRRERLRRAIQRVYLRCRSQRHRPVAEQHATLKSRLQGHFNYFGVNGNVGSLRLLLRQAERAWFKWLCRRSQRARLTWMRFKDLLKDFPLPRPRVVVDIWGMVP